MALAPNRQPILGAEDVRHALPEVAERGKILCLTPATAAGEVTGLATATGVGVTPHGILLFDVESMNFDRHGEYRQRDVVDVGSVIAVATKGEYETDLIVGTPVAGDTAYLAASGYVTPTASGPNGGAVSPTIGKFRSAKNANGFARLYVDL